MVSYHDNECVVSIFNIIQLLNWSAPLKLGKLQQTLMYLFMGGR